ncbi:MULTISPECIES: hypothetical protein [unclassified Rhizobium]|uniref:hypothetical protein n=1 Tax=unclassified Rhizobium TaxID=2613769 RepID=UPI0016215D1C|nr:MULTISPECIES: hypothetical protein [unclassified Rhizobium]MBB3545206.1 hypothetical protein [Rhizobium sp. BK399]MCS3743621.1 hypothetical protein [Rhizobium sp. BK661]MCS4096172.1 hypothetical protein [Rhizobium sp. BK176]
MATGHRAQWKGFIKFGEVATALGTRGGGRSLNSYNAASNGNFDDDQPLIDTRHYGSHAFSAGTPPRLLRRQLLPSLGTFRRLLRRPNEILCGGFS